LSVKEEDVKRAGGTKGQGTWVQVGVGSTASWTWMGKREGREEVFAACKRGSMKQQDGGAGVTMGVRMAI
jgi:hypothetical protein